MPELVLRAGQRQQLDFSPADLDAAAKTYRWTRAVDRTLYGFVELSFHRVAVGRAEELLGEDETQAVRVTVAELGTEDDVYATLSYQARLEVVSSYVGLVESGQLPPDSQALSSALSLGIAKSQKGDIAGAEALFGKASEWAADAEDRFSVAHSRAWRQGLQGHYDGAVALLEQALASEPEMAGQPSALAAQNDIALWLSFSGHQARAVETFQGVVDSANNGPWFGQPSHT